MAAAPTPIRSSDKPVDGSAAVPDAAAETAPLAAPAARKPGNAQRVFIGLIMLAVVGAGSIWVLGRGKENTDDAQIEGRIVSVSARVQGQVSQVLVHDNQQVNEGDILVEIDRRDLEAKDAAAKAEAAAARAQLGAAQAQLALTRLNAAATLRQAQGGLTQASSSLTANRSNIEQARADVTAAESAVKLADSDLERAKELIAQKTVPQAELDMRTARADQSHAQLEQARARLASMEANLQASSGGVEVAHGRLSAAATAPQQVAAATAAVAQAAARVDLADAQLRLADLNLSYADVRAPVRGVVSRRTVEQGQLVDPSRPLLALVPLEDIWVVANYKEDQIGEMRPGQRAKIHVDTYGRDFEGKVDSVASASGARFALLPPDNASGNFIKVVQRVPVLIRLNEIPKDTILRPGMSADTTVYTSGK